MINFREKSLAELAYIIEDASEAALAMRGHDDRAEAKYLDQVNDASTELARRQRGRGRLYGRRHDDERTDQLSPAPVVWPRTPVKREGGQS
jgi:hypothetical protein